MKIIESSPESLEAQFSVEFSPLGKGFCYAQGSVFPGA